MTEIKIHGKYDGDGKFMMNFISVSDTDTNASGTVADLDEMNIAMQALRMRGVKEEEKYLEVIPIYQFIRNRGDDKKEQVRSNTQWNVD